METGTSLMEIYRLSFIGSSDIYEHREAQRVDLRRNSATSPTGLYRCDIPTIAVHDDHYDYRERHCLCGTVYWRWRYNISPLISFYSHILLLGDVSIIELSLTVDSDLKWVVSFETNEHSRSEIESNRQTDTHTDPTAVTLAAHARRGLIKKS